MSSDRDNTSYSEKLKNPQWQKKRLRILERDNFTCRICGDKTKTLHVHHIEYDNKLNPWDIDDTKLITFCEVCHEAYHYLKSHPTLHFNHFVLFINYLFSPPFNDFAEGDIHEWCNKRSYKNING